MISQMPDFSDQRRALIVFGSSFNPIHEGHFALAQTYAKQNWVEGVLLLPTGNHAFNKKLAPSADRLKMIELTLIEQPDPKINISTLELDQPNQISYTYLTLKKLRKERPNTHLVFNIGSENLKDFHLWYEAEKLAHEFDIIVVERPGFPINEALLYPRMKVWSLDPGIIIPNLSSTLIRDKIKKKQPFAHLLCNSVAKYIKQQQLYL